LYKNEGELNKEQNSAHQSTLRGLCLRLWPNITWTQK